MTIAPYFVVLFVDVRRKVFCRRQPQPPQKIDAPGGARLFPRACSGAHENNWRHSHSNDFCRMDERRYQRGEAIWIILFYAWPTKAPTLSLSTPFASRTLAHSFQKCNIKSEPNIAHVRVRHVRNCGSDFFFHFFAVFCWLWLFFVCCCRWHSPGQRQSSLSKK